jgi:DNA-directed RNA polymerase subunit M/transcription elongation factor TFIIS
MSLDVKCPECATELTADEDAVGKTIKCPDCGAKFKVPGDDVEDRVKPSPAARDKVKGAAKRPEPEEEEEERPRRRRRRRDEDDDDEEDDLRRRITNRDDGTGGLIPYKNPRALIAYYCGVFSIIPVLGLVLGPAALVLGIMGLRYVNRHPTAKGTAHAVVGLVCGIVATLGNWGFVILILIAAIAGSMK